MSDEKYKNDTGKRPSRLWDLTENIVDRIESKHFAWLGGFILAMIFIVGVMSTSSSPRGFVVSVDDGRLQTDAAKCINFARDETAPVKIFDFLDCMQNKGYVFSRK